MKRPLDAFLRGAAPAPNGPLFQAESSVRRRNGRVDWDATVGALAEALCALGAPEFAEGLGRLLLCALTAVGEERVVAGVGRMLLTGERDALAGPSWDRAYDPPPVGMSWYRAWMLPVRQWAEAGGWVLPPRPTRAEDPTGDASGPADETRWPLRHRIFEGMGEARAAAEHRFKGSSHARSARHGAERALRELISVLVEAPPGMGAEEAFSVARHMLAPGQMRDAPLGLRCLATRQGQTRTVDYYDGRARVLRAVYLRRMMGFEWSELGGYVLPFCLESLRPAPRAAPSERHYDGAVADLVRRGVTYHFGLRGEEGEPHVLALLRAGFAPDAHAMYKIAPVDALALAVARPAPLF